MGRLSSLCLATVVLGNNSLIFTNRFRDGHPVLNNTLSSRRMQYLRKSRDSIESLQVSNENLTHQINLADLQPNVYTFLTQQSSINTRIIECDFFDQTEGIDTSVDLLSCSLRVRLRGGNDGSRRNVNATEFDEMRALMDNVGIDRISEASDDLASLSTRVISNTGKYHASNPREGRQILSHISNQNLLSANPHAYAMMSDVAEPHRFPTDEPVPYEPDPDQGEFPLPVPSSGSDATEDDMFKEILPQLRCQFIEWYEDEKGPPEFMSTSSNADSSFSVKARRAAAASMPPLPLDELNETTTWISLEMMIERWLETSVMPHLESGQESASANTPATPPEGYVRSEEELSGHPATADSAVDSQPDKTHEASSPEEGNWLENIKRAEQQTTIEEITGISNDGVALPERGPRYPPRGVFVEDDAG